MKRPEPCLRCGSKNIFWSDCGYSSFNCGTAKCGDCGYELKLDNLGCFPENEIRRIWNAQKKKAVQRLKQLQEEAAELEKILNKSAIRRRRR